MPKVRLRAKHVGYAIGYGVGPAKYPAWCTGAEVHGALCCAKVFKKKPTKPARKSGQRLTLQGAAWYKVRYKRLRDGRPEATEVVERIYV